MKKVIALAVAMASATGANAAFDTTTVFGENALNNFIFTAWTTTDGLDSSVNVDLNINPVNDAGTGFRDFSTEQYTFSIDLTPLGDDLSTLQWTVFGNNGAGTGNGLEVYTSGNNQPTLGDAAFSNQFTQMRNFMNANQGDAFVTIGTEGQANFGANVVTPNFSSVGVTGSMGDMLSFLAYDRQSGLATYLTDISFDGSTLTIGTPSAVPVPAAAWLFGSALLGLAGIGRRRG